MLLGVGLRGTRDSILAVALTHTRFNRSNNDEGIVAGLVDGDGRKLAGLVAVLVLTVIVTVVARRRLGRSERNALDTVFHPDAAHPQHCHCEGAVMNPGHNPPPEAGVQPGRMFGTVTDTVRLAATHAAAATDDGTGGGFWTAMRIYPERRLAIFAMANAIAKWDGDRLFTRLKDLSWT